MKRFIKYAALIATVLMVCSSAWAYDYRDHINIAPNNQGDALIFPWFLALDGGWETKLTVINADTENCVVAKVVLRSFKNSEELLDFFIFLSPADVWTGKIYYNTTSQTINIFSDDDSIATSTAPTFATTDDPVDFPVFPLECSDDGSFLGYVEVITSAVGYLGTRPVDKKVIYAAYNPSGDSFGPLPDLDGDEYMDYVGEEGWYKYLAGYMEFGNTTLGLSAGFSATNFKDYGNTAHLNVGNETKFGQGSSNSIGEIEAAISKDWVAMPYVNKDDLALHFFTFPTKQTNFASCTAVTTTSPYFRQNSDSKTCVVYSLTVFDLKENSPKTGSPFSGGTSTIDKFCHEVNFVGASGFPYTEGWGEYFFGDDQTQTATFVDEDLWYYGTPVLATYLYIGERGLSGNYGSWYDEEVYAGVIDEDSYELYDYKYSDITGWFMYGS